jgi:tripartite-type tricarboxylate transporter receptor subunit TctC
MSNRCLIPMWALAVSIAGSIAAFAQSSFPSRPIHLIVGFSAGGPTDVLARIIGSKMGEILGQQVVVENRTGGFG